VPLPDGVLFEQGRLPWHPRHHRPLLRPRRRAVAGRVVLVQGGAGAVGLCAVQLALRAGARVVATVRSREDEAIASRAGAHEVIRTGGIPTNEVVDRILNARPEELPTVVEVAFDANIVVDTEVLTVGGSLAAYATGEPRPAVSVLGAAVQERPAVLPGQRSLPGRGERPAAAAS